MLQLNTSSDDWMLLYIIYDISMYINDIWKCSEQYLSIPIVLVDYLHTVGSRTSKANAAIHKEPF
mgnify:CR=1 FL=1